MLIKFPLTYGWASLVRQWTMEKREGYVIKILLRADFKLAFVSLKSKFTNLAWKLIIYTDKISFSY